MIGFFVPVKSKILSSDWSHFCKLLNRTLHSICSQKNGDFEVIVACHDIPDGKYEHPKVHFIKVDFPIPDLTQTDKEKDRQLKEGDKARKILAAMDYANANFDLDYYMVVDSDDCIHNGISQFVTKNKHLGRPGWYFKKGYFYKEGKSLAFLNRLSFNDVCGTCLIVRKDLFRFLIVETPFLYFFHEKMEVNGQTLQPFPLPGAIYSMANGENHLMTSQNIKELVNSPKFFTKRHLRSIYSKLSKYRPRYIGKRFRETYNFYSV